MHRKRSSDCGCRFGKHIVFQASKDEQGDKQGLPILNSGQMLKVMNTEVKSLKTTPPAHYTEGTLLTAMVRCRPFCYR